MILLKFGSTLSHLRGMNGIPSLIFAVIGSGSLPIKSFFGTARIIPYCIYFFTFVGQVKWSSETATRK